MGRRTVLLCDACGTVIPENKGGTMRLNYSDARRGAKQADVCDSCAEGLPGNKAKRRGRAPQPVAA